MEKSRSLGAMCAFAVILLSLNISASPVGSTYNVELTGNWEYPPPVGITGSETYTDNVLFDGLFESISGSCDSTAGPGCPVNNVYASEFVNNNHPSLPAGQQMLGFNFGGSPTLFNNHEYLVGDVTITINGLIWGGSGIENISIFGTTADKNGDDVIYVPSIGGAFNGNGTPGAPLSIQLSIAASELLDINGLNVFFDVTPIPIPATVWLFGSGLLGFVGIARRKKPA